MDMVTRTPEQFFQDFIESRRASAARYRWGESDAIVRLIGFAASGVERVGGRIRRWAGGSNAETDSLPRGMMHVR